MAFKLCIIWPYENCNLSKTVLACWSIDQAVSAGLHRNIVILWGPIFWYPADIVMMWTGPDRRDSVTCCVTTLHHIERGSACSVGLIDTWNNGKEVPRLDLTSSTTPGQQIHYSWPHPDSKYKKSMWLAAVLPCRAPIGRLSPLPCLITLQLHVCYISQLLRRDSFSVSQPPSHYSMGWQVFFHHPSISIVHEPILCGS